MIECYSVIGSDYMVTQLLVVIECYSIIDSDWHVTPLLIVIACYSVIGSDCMVDYTSDDRQRLVLPYYLVD